jgi:choline monooxygenase
VPDFDLTRPLDQAATIPAEWYTDPALTRRERDAVFAASWQLVGRLEQVTSPGSFLTADIAGLPVTVIRGSDGTLRAFANVCRHRATVLLHEPCGVIDRVRCQYHGWTYDLEGRLRGAPEFDGVRDFHRDEHGLTPLEVAVRSPWVFVRVRAPHPADRSANSVDSAGLTALVPAEAGRLAPVGSLHSALAGSLAELLAPLAERGLGPEVDRLAFVEARDYELACNWKVFVDNYLDGGYHVNTVHPSLASVLDYTSYRIDLAPAAALQWSPLRAPEPGEDASAAGVRTGATAWYWWVWPNLMINVYDGVMDTNLVLPLGPDRCRVRFEWWFDPALIRDAPERVRESIAVSDRIQLEDVAISEHVQRGLASGFFSTGRYSVRREAAGWHFHRLLATALTPS